MKKYVIIVLCLLFALSFVSCSSSNNENSSENTNLYINGNDLNSDSTVPENNAKNETEGNSLNSNVVYWEGVEYDVNSVLNASDEIEDVIISENNGITTIEFWWNYFSNDEASGYSNELIMFYDNSLSEVQAGKQTVLGSAYYEVDCNDMTTKWSWFDSSNKLIYYTLDSCVYDSNGELIGYKDNQDGEYIDINGNKFDISTLDPFLDIIEDYNY